MTYQLGEQMWKLFTTNVLAKEGGLTVVLEVGAQSPLLAWPNKSLAAKGEGRVKLVRVGSGFASTVNWEMKDTVGVDGDIRTFLSALKDVRKVRGQ